MNGLGGFPDQIERRKEMIKQRKLTHLLVIIILIIGLIASAAVFGSIKVLASDGKSIPLDTLFYVAKPNHGAIEQIADLTSQGYFGDADLIKNLIDSPQAVWFTSSTPQSVQQGVKNTVQRASGKGTVPILVAYNIPFRDCSQYSAGGATSVQEYKAWIDGLAAGIGNKTAVVILEPDGLGIIPWYDPYGSADGSNALEWCQPAEADPETAASDRFEMLNYAVDALEAHPNVSVYLDGTHSAWLGSGDSADRLVQAGVERADGFFLNVSNYQFTTNLTQYGNWVSDCITYATILKPGNFFTCPNQYWNGGPDGTKIAELLGPWVGVGLSRYGEWSDDTDDPYLNTSGINSRYASMLGSTQPTTHFVIDTSRNGQGPWTPPPDHPAGDPQDWCNPPNRGLGNRSTANTGMTLVDAYLWVKIPGESDGQCYRWTSGPLDPVRGIQDPAAGQWFPYMALELVHNANPPLEP
jgi:endoglucanase